MTEADSRILVMRKIDWGGAGQIPEALGQDRRGSSLPINRYFFLFLFAASGWPCQLSSNVR